MGRPAGGRWQWRSCPVCLDKQVLCLSAAISRLPQSTEAGCEEVGTGGGQPESLFPPVRSSWHVLLLVRQLSLCPHRPQVTTLLPCQNDIRSLSRDLTQASVLGTRLLLSREPKHQQGQSAWIHPRAHSSCGWTSACKVHPFLLSPPLGAESCPIFGLYHIQYR